jgi:DNA (cytosine-5)-methyltransferase 1
MMAFVRVNSYASRMASQSFYKSQEYREPSNPIGNVAELFAGVGGFRIGLSRSGWKTIYSNQWEPSTKKQHASEVYISRFGKKGHSNVDISKVEKLPSNIDLLVGGFPCQDYSVAKTASRAKGLRGKKGVLWWEILRLIKSSKPKFIFLENVDRLLKSPSKQRGRDFAIMLRTLGDAGYSIEWRVINAAEFGFPQRRIRVFIVATKNSIKQQKVNPGAIISKNGVLARAFPVEEMISDISEVNLTGNIEEISSKFNKNEKFSKFLDAGFYSNGIAYTVKTIAVKSKKSLLLGDILQKDSQISTEYWVDEKRLPEWKYLKGAKSIKRTHKASGVTYNYAEGKMAFPDKLSNPSRTILTAEGGSTPSRFKHIIKTKNGYRRLTPIELERLNGFPDDWTRDLSDGSLVNDGRRAFFMGNALVIGLVTKVGKILADEINK